MSLCAFSVSLLELFLFLSRVINLSATCPRHTLDPHCFNLAVTRLDDVGDNGDNGDDDGEHGLDDDNDNDEAGVLREERPCSLPVEEAAHRHLSTCRGQTGAERKMITMIMMIIIVMIMTGDRVRRSQ